MTEDDRLKALTLVREAKQAVASALSSEHSAAGAKPLEGLLNCLERLEGDLIVEVLDAKLAELQQFNGKLVAINSGINQEMGKLKSVARKVDLAAKAIGVVINAVGKIAALV